MIPFDLAPGLLGPTRSLLSIISVSLAFKAYFTLSYSIQDQYFQNGPWFMSETPDSPGPGQDDNPPSTPPGPGDLPWLGSPDWTLVPQGLEGGVMLHRLANEFRGWLPASGHLVA